MTKPDENNESIRPAAGWLLVFRGASGNCVVVDACDEFSRDLVEAFGWNWRIDDVGLGWPPRAGLWRWEGHLETTYDCQSGLADGVDYVGKYLPEPSWEMKQ